MYLAAARIADAVWIDGDRCSAGLARALRVLFPNPMDVMPRAGTCVRDVPTFTSVRRSVVHSPCVTLS